MIARTKGKKIRERLKSEQNSGDLLDRHQNNRTVQIADKSKSSNKNICYSNGI